MGENGQPGSIHAGRDACEAGTPRRISGGPAIEPPARPHRLAAGAVPLPSPGWQGCSLHPSQCHRISCSYRSDPVGGGNPDRGNLSRSRKFRARRASIRQRIREWRWRLWRRLDTAPGLSRMCSIVRSPLRTPTPSRCPAGSAKAKEHGPRPGTARFLRVRRRGESWRNVVRNESRCTASSSRSKATNPGTTRLRPIPLSSKAKPRIATGFAALPVCAGLRPIRGPKSLQTGRFRVSCVTRASHHPCRQAVDYPV